jgi:hypothetical protein
MIMLKLFCSGLEHRLLKVRIVRWLLEFHQLFIFVLKGFVQVVGQGFGLVVGIDSETVNNLNVVTCCLGLVLVAEGQTCSMVVVFCSISVFRK